MRRDFTPSLNNTFGPLQRNSVRLGSVLLLVLLSLVLLSTARAQEISREQMKGLDEQVQEIKSDVLAIAAELSQLEERLLFPSNTQVSVFVSLEEGESFRLDAVEIQINGQAVARHIYSYKELEALQQGGVQRIYTGNIPTGPQQLEVSVSGKLRSGRDFTLSERFSFDKGFEPKLLGVKLSDPAGTGIQLGNW
ncbi:MAG: hypothetical protein ACNA8J_04515 [Gammaproteobacteria bacterium]